MYKILINTNKYIWMHWYVTRWSPEFLWFHNALILPIIYCIYLIDSCFYLNLYLLLFLDVYCIYFICALSQSSQSKDLFIAFWRMRSVSSCLSRHQWWEEMSVRARAGVRELRPSGPGENGGKRKGKQNEIASETGIIIIEGNTQSIRLFESERVDWGHSKPASYSLHRENKERSLNRFM